MLSVQTFAFFAAFVAIAVAVPASGSSQRSSEDALSAIHAIIHRRRSGSLNFSRSAPAITSNISTNFLTAARPSKSEPVDIAPPILSRGKNADQSLSATVSLAKAFITKIKRVQTEFAGTHSSKVSRAAIGKDESRLQSLSTGATEGRRDGGGARARRASELQPLVTRMKANVAAREQVDGFRGGKDHSGPVSRAGLTLDPCIRSSDCVGERVCSLPTGYIELCNGRTNCMCSTDSPQQCTSSADCVAGETCETVSESSLCISATATASIETLDGTGWPNGFDGKSPDNSASTEGDRLTYDFCLEDSDCKSPRGCFDPAMVPCSGNTVCLCSPEKIYPCDSSASCFSGEVCVHVPDQGPVCMSPIAAKVFVESGGTIIADGSESIGNSEGDLDDKLPPTDFEDQPPATDPDDKPVKESDEDDGQGQAPVPVGDVGLNSESENGSSDEGVCVDAKALAHMPPSDLVFERHPRARVLCDAQSSCATPGHMVAFRGETMMMKSYCKLTACSERVMEVNSPRYRRQLLVSSNTDELKFTAFAARYETRGEETLMSMAVRMGW